MQLRVVVGDVLTEAADVLVSTANPWLNLSGGVNGAIREAVGCEIQTELHRLLIEKDLAALPVGSVVRSAPYNLPFKHILHAVAIDPFYDSSINLVRSTFADALEMAVKLGASTLSSPTLATGYGRMSIADFGLAIAPLIDEPSFSALLVTIVVRSYENKTILDQATST